MQQVVKKYRARPGFKPMASGTPSLHSTMELPNHMPICLTIYHQIPVPEYIAIHLDLPVGLTSIQHKQQCYVIYREANRHVVR